MSVYTYVYVYLYMNIYIIIYLSVTAYKCIKNENATP